jgi:hypothetical protein
MARQPRPSTRSSNPKTVSKRGRNRAPGAAPRAHRDDTPEAREQNRRASKTHPTRNPGARRKDKRGPATSAATTPAPSPRQPAMKRREKRGLKRRNSPS